jgi:hypothetical protein
MVSKNLSDNPKVSAEMLERLENEPDFLTRAITGDGS